MNTNSYLPLTEYSSKYKVSISTLRRRIKTKDIKFRFDQGKYFIMDEPTQRPSLDPVMVMSVPSPKKEIEKPIEQKRAFEVSSSGGIDFFSNSDSRQLGSNTGSKNDEPILTAANRLLTELKKAYMQILQEKEEQALHLKEEVSDLKTLVRVLESENERLRKY